MTGQWAPIDAYSLTIRPIAIPLVIHHRTKENAPAETTSRAPPPALT